MCCLPKCRSIVDNKGSCVYIYIYSKYDFHIQNTVIDKRAETVFYIVLVINLVNIFQMLPDRYTMLRQLKLFM